MPVKLKIIPLEEINKRGHNTLLEALDIRISRLTEDYIEATMPVDKRTHQVYGLLHGGASAALAETLGSIGGMLTTNPATHYCVGIAINASHLKAVKSGRVTGRAMPLHTGRSTQVWEIKITDEQQQLVCISRLTLAVVPVKK